jgi:hypothetical protein
MVKLQFFCLPAFFALPRPSSGTHRAILDAYTSNDVVCDKEVRFLGVIDTKIFLGDYTFLQLFGGRFACKSKKSNNFRSAGERLVVHFDIYWDEALYGSSAWQILRFDFTMYMGCRQQSGWEDIVQFTLSTLTIAKCSKVMESSQIRPVHSHYAFALVITLD